MLLVNLRSLTVTQRIRPHSPASQDAALRNIENCVIDVPAWLLSNRRLINDDGALLTRETGKD